MFSFSFSTSCFISIYLIPTASLYYDLKKQKILQPVIILIRSKIIEASIDYRCFQHLAKNIKRALLLILNFDFAKPTFCLFSFIQPLVFFS